MSLLKEFKEFASKGNVLDLAVGVIIGGAFGKIVSSLVADIIMPPIAMILGGVNFTEIKLQLKPGVTLNVGNFVQMVVDFVIVAAAVFLMVKALNSFKARMAKEEAAAPAINKQEALLEEIRDLLKHKN